MELAAAVLIIVLAIGLMGASHGLRTGMLRSSRKRERTRVQGRRHLDQGTQLLNRAKSKEAALEADKAISLDPKDAASHLLKAFALERQGHMVAALRSLNTALWPPLAKSLSPSEIAEALLKRAEIAVGMKSKRRLDTSLADLNASLAINPGNVKTHCLLGRCYEMKGLRDEARQAFRAAAAIDPESREINQAVSRLS
ncbi:hypothetical protein SUGI_0281110 [Cryptomeria japonica]|uniref:uncharacterized protein LOC131048022 n=1 Tax=Cryptomeria japonica TaxID=3369 RepID=UPI002408ECCF|nr:uncharacterized protein LOC131048022 [Cryptomeria japonica]XP_057837840.1 uncharacterized protein LOC131048022 [Cryptomeria japonica]GLJ16477.1 hypothetical protein SUGI_0281110 [Cryptomeria japonica]